MPTGTMIAPRAQTVPVQNPTGHSARVIEQDARHALVLVPSLSHPGQYHSLVVDRMWGTAAHTTVTTCEAARKGRACRHLSESVAACRKAGLVAPRRERTEEI